MSYQDLKYLEGKPGRSSSLKINTVTSSLFGKILARGLKEDNAGRDFEPQSNADRRGRQSALICVPSAVEFGCGRRLRYGLGGLCGSVFKEALKSSHNSRLPPGGLLRPPARRVEIHSVNRRTVDQISTHGFCPSGAKVTELIAGTISRGDYLVPWNSARTYGV